MRALGGAALVALVLLLSGCTPHEGGRCTTIGEIVTLGDGSQLQCRTDTDKGQKTPRWNKV